jgi:pimeloyl-ACP methyl ester carboxylesterase
LRVALQGGGPLVVMVHGFPESWYSWRHQMGPIAAAGFTACAIDVRRYGGSDKPHEVEAYSLEHLSGDVAGLIAALAALLACFRGSQHIVQAGRVDRARA